MLLWLLSWCLPLCHIFIFFFSSRRRHTRFDCDWSSDVCSSDLTGQLVPTAAYHVPKEYLATLSSAPLPLKDQGFFLPLWAERRPVYSDDIAQDERFTHGMFRSFPHQSGLLLPLIVDDEVIGGFYLVWWTVRRRFSAHDLRALEHICEQVGFFLRNAHLYEQAERNRHRLEVLNDVSRRLAAVHDADEVLTIIVNEAARLVGAEAAGLRLLEGDDLVVSARTESAATVMSRPRLKLGESLSGLVVATGESVVAEDLAADPRHAPAPQGGARGGRLRPRERVPPHRRRRGARAGDDRWRRGRPGAPAATDIRSRSVPRGLEEPTSSRGTVRRGPRAGAAARSGAPRPRVFALAPIRRRAARRRRARDRRRERRQQAEPAADQPPERRAVQLALPEPRDRARGEPALRRSPRPRAGSDAALCRDPTAGHQPRPRTPARCHRRTGDRADGV